MIMKTTQDEWKIYFKLYRCMIPKFLCSLCKHTYTQRKETGRKLQCFDMERGDGSTLIIFFVIFYILYNKLINAI